MSVLRLHVRRGPRFTLFPYLVAYPVFLYFVIFLIFPILYLVFLSLASTDQFSFASSLTGFKNYKRLLADRLFWQSLWQTLYFAGMRILGIVPLSLLAAVGINQVLRLRSYYTLAYFSPVITSMAAVSLIWLWI